MRGRRPLTSGKQGIGRVIDEDALASLTRRCRLSREKIAHSDQQSSARFRDDR
jgi:hypothetical protein